MGTLTHGSAALLCFGRLPGARHSSLIAGRSQLDRRFGFGTKRLSAGICTKHPVRLLIRLYPPKAEFLAGSWSPPLVQRQLARGATKAIRGGDRLARGRMGLRLVHDLANVHKKRVAERSASLVVRAETPPAVGHAWITQP
jgi:hypothetical protein